MLLHCNECDCPLEPGDLAQRVRDPAGEDETYYLCEDDRVEDDSDTDDGMIDDEGQFVESLE